MRVKAFIEFKGKFDLIYIGRISKNGIFHFRNKQLRKACLNKLRDTFNYDCLGGSLTIPDINRDSVTPKIENNKYIVTYNKNV